MNKFIAAAILAVCFSASAVIVPDDRRITWDPGVRGGIPTRTAIFTNLAAGTTRAVIQSCLNNCPSNQVVKLGAGAFSLNNNLTIPTGVTLRGSGIASTTLSSASGYTADNVIFFDSSYDYDWNAFTVRNIVSCTKGATNISTTANHGWAAGDYLIVDNLEQHSGYPVVDKGGSLGDTTWCGRPDGVGTRVMGQIVQVLSVSNGTNATFDPPLYWSYTNAPQAIKMGGLTHYAGVEDLKIDNTVGRAYDTVVMQGAMNCWLYNVELLGNYRRAVWGYGGFWCTFQKCTMRGGTPVGSDKQAQYTSDRSYPIFFGPHFSASLVTDCIFEKLTSGFCFEGCASGNVVSYNFITNMWWESTGDSPRRFSVLGHGPHPFMNLVEGNWCSDRIRADEYWGTSSHHTYLRNRVCQADRGAGDAQTWTVDIERRNQYYSFVGNLLGGSPSVSENNYELINGESAPYSDEDRDSIWKIGYESLGEGNTLYDSTVLGTMIRWGNWSYRTNDSVSGSGVVWAHTNNVSDTSDQTIPDSYYLGEKPTWFASLDWPAFSTASASTMDPTNIPAGYRYVCNADPPAGENAAPSISAQPTSQTNLVGQSVTFTVTATGTPAPTYQWSLGGTNVASATASSWTKSSLIISDNGLTAQVGITNSEGGLLSNEVYVGVTNAPAGLIGRNKVQKLKVDRLILR
jgi:hypothetical protein